MPFGTGRRGQDVVAGRQRRDVLEAGRRHAQPDGQLTGRLESGRVGLRLGAGRAGGEADRDGDRCEHGDDLLHVGTSDGGVQDHARNTCQAASARARLRDRLHRSIPGTSTLTPAPRPRLGAGRYERSSTGSVLSPSSSGVASRAAPWTRSRAASMAERKLAPSLLKGRGAGGDVGGRSIGGRRGLRSRPARRRPARRASPVAGSISFVSSPGAWGSSASGVIAGTASNEEDASSGVERAARSSEGSGRQIRGGGRPDRARLGLGLGLRLGGGCGLLGGGRTPRRAPRRAGSSGAGNGAGAGCSNAGNEGGAGSDGNAGNADGSGAGSAAANGAASARSGVTLLGEPRAQREAGLARVERLVALVLGVPRRPPPRTSADPPARDRGGGAATCAPRVPAPVLRLRRPVRLSPTVLPSCQLSSSYRSQGSRRQRGSSRSDSAILTGDNHAFC